ncbi:uncharacterized protein [Acropora muricata]|uniref:uncharacterized protein n=1 Tax=Acropora muricata TaxID=159855 RepID=UPI0010FC9A5A
MSQDTSAQVIEASSPHKEPLYITLLASEWNSLGGGLSTLNREFAIHLAQQTNVRVSLLVPVDACNDRVKREAQSFNINVVEAKQRRGCDPLEWLGIPPEGHRMDVVVGHGVKLGWQVHLIKNAPQFRNCKWVHMVHTAPEDLGKYKGYENPTSRGEQKHWDEVGLCKCADLVVPVGAKLMKAYFSYLQGCKKGEDIFGLTPGLFDREFGDIVQTPKTENDDFKVLLCGRGDNEDFELKGYDIAVKAFADPRLKGKSYHLVFVGAPDGMQDEVRKRLLNHGTTEEQLTVRKFVQSRSGIKELLCEVDLAIMPSKCEGFGLVALEALSAGLPVLVGSNSGFASAIRGLPLGAYSIVDSDDPAKWAEAIERVRVRHGVCLKEIKMLRECYGKEYVWKTQCEALVERLWGMISDDQGASISQALAADDSMEQQTVVIPEGISSGELSKFGADTGTMSSLIGILVDVSGSKRNNVGSEVNKEQVSWARSIFKVVDELIKHDVESSNKTFALAVGCPYEPQVFDLLSTARVATEEARAIKDLSSRVELRELIDEALDILEINGAVRVRTWGKMHVLLKVLDKTTAAAILYYLVLRPNFTRRFVFECLPRECREVVVKPLNLLAELGFRTISIVLDHEDNENLQALATESSVREAIDKGKKLMEDIRREIMVPVNEAAIMSVQSASEILHNSIEEKNEEEIDEKRVDELLEAVEPFIYGGTPLIQAMHHSVHLFSHLEFTNHKKLLFILSDGQPADGRDPPVQQLSDLGVTIVSCFITREGLSDPRRLYSLLDESWEAPAKFMFKMSSTITTQKIPRTLFLKEGWKIDIENNETRLFFHVNHPDVVKDVCDMAKKGVLSQDVLSDLLSSVDLDVYINQANDSFGAKEQEKETCYANASAAVMHLAMQRIIGRDGGYPNFFELREKLIAKYGEYGASTKKVLEEICPDYRLQCETVDAIGAMEAISAKRPVVATFHLTGAQWDQFDKFFKESPRGILTRSYLDSKHVSTSDAGGHAVVLTSYDAESLRLMNSWGDDWADQGFFRVQNSDVLGLKFVDVFWTLDDLSEKEKEAYEQHGAEVASKLIKSLKGIHVVKYKCPLCAVKSKVVDFTGGLLKAKCPACGGTFNANKEGGDLALNLYLMSLIHDEEVVITPPTGTVSPNFFSRLLNFFWKWAPQSLQH